MRRLATPARTMFTCPVHAGVRDRSRTEVLHALIQINLSLRRGADLGHEIPRQFACTPEQASAWQPVNSNSQKRHEKRRTDARVTRTAVGKSIVGNTRP